MATAISAFPGYIALETLQHGEDTIVYRAKRLSDQRPVIVKLLAAEYPSLELVTRLKQEYRIPQDLPPLGVVQPLSLENHQNRFALILEDFGGISLRQLLKSGRLEIGTFLPIAIQITTVLGVLHRQQVIHKDIKPSNIIINPLTNEIKLTDFGIASLLPRETLTLETPETIEGTLSYLSPEQTGRMNRVLDYRTDFYSLGITFYELLTATLPFQSLDPLELIHCHIAKTATAPHLVHADIPEVISGIVMKLMAKTAEERYQSADGLKADLERCWLQWQTSNQIDLFVPGEIDSASQFLLPQKLYGREVEVAALLKAFEQVATRTNFTSLPSLVLVSGYSGVGKTSLVYEIHKPITKQRGYFIAGKFDQLNRNTPYSALVQAFQSLIRQVLAEGADRLQVWQERLSTALMGNAQVIIDVIPEVELLVGQQSTVVGLEANATETRFIQVFQAFVQVFAQADHPLVLFLDDLQWADLASLQFLQQLLTDASPASLLVIGAYRDNEVSAEHPLMQMVARLFEAEIPLTELQLQPLQFANVNQFVADTLRTDLRSDRTQSLSKLLFNKTQGNPFFLTQLLKSLYEQQFIHFDFIENRWLWSLEQIQSMSILDLNVIELVARNIRQLPPETQTALKLAACIGNTFSLNVLAVVNNQSLITTADQLWAALQAGLVLPIGNNYKLALAIDATEQDLITLGDTQLRYRFLHDRVQQAAYSLIPAAETQITHLEIGRLLLRSSYPGDKLFDIVNQLNIGAALITDVAELEELAQLNLEAGQRAIGSLAYTIAQKGLLKGIEILGAERWQRNYDLCLALHEAAITATFLNNEFEQAKALSDTALQQAKTVLERAQIYNLQVQFYLAQNQMPEAIATARQVLLLLGVPLSDQLPELPTSEILQQLPEMQDANKLAATQVLSSVVDASAGTPEIFRQVVHTMVRLCIEYGNSRFSAYTYMVYAWLLCGQGDIEQGYAIGQLAIALLSEYDARELRCKVFQLFSTFVQHWQEPLQHTLQPLQTEIQGCLEVGNKEYACFSAMHYACYLVLSGQPLTTVLRQQQIYAEMIAKMRRSLQLTYTQVWQQAAANLAGQAEHPTELIGEYFDESVALPQLIAENGSFSIFAIYVAKTMLSYLFKQYEKAIAHAQMATQYEIKAGLATTATYHFYSALAFLARCSNVDPSTRQIYLDRVVYSSQKLHQWAISAPANYQHKADLVAAEIARVTQQPLEAMELYDRAIEGAKANGYVQEEALAYELAAEFYISLKRTEIARSYLVNAYYRYAQWDALAKIYDLEARHVELLAALSRDSILGSIQKTRSRRTTTTVTSDSKGKQELDLATVIKASQMLSSEMVLDNLLTKLIQLAIENVGAQRGMFLVIKTNRWCIEAQGKLEQKDDASIEFEPSQTTEIDLAKTVPLSIIRYVHRTQQYLVLDHAELDDRFQQDVYITLSQPKSILCFPILHQKQLIGILYLENRLATGVFTPARLEVLKILSAQVAISIENARLYQELQTHSQTLEANNQALQTQTQQLEAALQDLRQTQAQLVQTEKISSLGQLVAGVAHEVNNPVSFIAGNIAAAQTYTQDLINLLQLYQSHLPNPPQDIQDLIEDIDLEFLLADLPKLLTSMQLGTDRIRDIMTSLRTFSRTDATQKQRVNLHDGLDSTLLILYHRLKAKEFRPEIQLLKEYGNLPTVPCYPGQLNQVFMNLIANAIDALDESCKQHSYQENTQHPKWIRVHTEIQDQHVVISIADNGPGMPSQVQQRLFEPFFTTKPAEKGTGLGLSISHQIITDKHGGTLTCLSAIGQGTEFVIHIPLAVE
jgi:predicted ATPase/signal transduction histidine kinase/tRNA A-37 threonylcarbamoyl transferase component Bud32